LLRTTKSKPYLVEVRMSVNWEALQGAVAGAGEMKELLAVLKAHGVESPVEWLKAASKTYAYNRAYRNRRNQSVKALKQEIEELKAAAAG
jgi:hypothetical protein